MPRRKELKTRNRTVKNKDETRMRALTIIECLRLDVEPIDDADINFD
jgi:hypothetical protein